MRISIRLKLVVTGALLVGMLGAPQASADSPWWHLSSGARPTVLQPGVAKNEVQDLTVTGSVGETFVVLNVTKKEAKEIEEGMKAPPPFAELAVGDSASVVQTGLEIVYGAGNVEVTSGEPIGSEPYVVAFKGALTDQPVRLMNTELSALFGFAGEAKVTQATLGRPDGQIVVTAANLGDADVNGEAPHAPVRFVDKLPSGLKAVSIEGVAEAGALEQQQDRPVDCSLPAPREARCEFAKTLPPYHPIEILIGVEASVPSGEPNEVSVSGGEAPSASIVRAVRVGGEPAGFGVEDYELTNEEEGGALDMQAGSHPFQQTTTITLNQSLEQVEDGLLPQPVVLAKDLNFRWPAGLIGNPTPFPRCTLAQFLQTVGEKSEPVSACPSNTAVGVSRTLVNLLKASGGAPVGTRFEAVVPLFNLEPSVGEPARFGFRVDQTPVFIDPSVRSGGDYGITVSVDNIAQTVGFVSSQVTVWGVPGDPRHDSARGYGCLTQALGLTPELPCKPSEQSHPPPFLSLPTSCTGSLQTSIEADSWEEPGVFKSFGGERMPALDGCGRLPFDPEIKVSPDGQQASTPTGLTTDVHVPQEGQLNAAGDAQSNIKTIAVTLPEGVTLNPSAADGLQACSESLIGYLPGASHPPSELDFTPKLPGSFGSSEPLEPGVNFCPDASKVGTVKITTPLLPKGDPLEGAVYLASPQNFASFPQENPFESLVAMYVVAEDPVSGSLVKLPGKVSLNPNTGQIEATFEDTPQLAFEDAELHFFGGERAPLATPALCRRPAGEGFPAEEGYKTVATFTPWSGNPPVTRTSEFYVTSGPNGGPCPNPRGDQSPTTLPFAASLVSDTTNINAGSFSPLTTTLSRPDGNQQIQSVQLHYPPGVSGLLSGVKLCPEAQANVGTCGPESEIGETTVSVGVGGDPFTVTGGKVYITEKYAGAPFGLSIVNPAKAGPFDLMQGNPVVVRAKVEVNPITAALTITTDSSGVHAIPTIIEGFALQIQHVNVLVNRPGFTFNPTNCNPQKITGTINSAEGSSSPVEVPFQVTNCASLKFAPKFAVSTSGKTSKAKGASLAVHLTYPKALFGSQANIARVKVDLPKQLPSRLTTLQKACTAKQFETNPAGCPSASIIGHAKAITPLIPVPLEGPAYFVSHGGEAFPSLIMVLQGYGVTVDLVGTTFISKAGITSSTFKTVPDAPVGSFELTLPEGKFSALAANGNLCKSQSKLKMPTEFVAQNGLKISESTKVGVTGCPKSKKAKHAKKAGKGKKGKHGKK